jgi:hypothetical protein
MPGSGATLTRETLRRILAEEGHDLDAYSVDGRRDRRLLDAAWVIDRWSDRWVVYHTERGAKRDIRKYRTEDAACRAMLSRVRGDAQDPADISEPGN